MGWGAGEAILQPQLLPLPNPASFSALATWVLLISDLSEAQALFRAPLAVLGFAHCLLVGNTGHPKAPLACFLSQKDDTLALPVAVSK